jgi:hypothetical protein
LFGDPRNQFAGHVAADVEGGKVTVTPITPEECDDSVEESCRIADEEKGTNVGEWDGSLITSSAFVSSCTSRFPKNEPILSSARNEAGLGMNRSSSVFTKSGQLF